MKRAAFAFALVAAVSVSAAAPQTPSRAEILAAMKRATTFMVEKVSTNGGYVWGYLPDLSRRWGEIEARPTMVWLQPPGTATMGHVFLDAYHATGDEYYYQAAEKTTGAVMATQLAVGGWNYVADFAGPKSLAEWYATVGKNAWRLEEFQKDWGNATFDDVVTIDAARLLLRMYVEKRDQKYRPALDKAIKFVLDSQYPVGAWPQRFPQMPGAKPDYTSYITFNDDVAGENIDFLLQCLQTLGDKRLIDPILRGMYAFVVLQQGPPQPGWALQYTLDYKPSGARTYEPNGLVTHTSARNVELLLKFYTLTGDTRFLARVPEAIDWLASLTLPDGIAPKSRTHPTFVEIGTNQPLYVHREGSNVVNGRYYADKDSTKTLGHYSAFRPVNVADLRKRYQDAKATPAADLAKKSPLSVSSPLPRYFALDPTAKESVTQVISGLRPDGAWIAPLEYISHPYKGDGPTTRPAADYSTTHVGDEWDTSPFPNTKVVGISTTTFIRRMTVLINALQSGSPAPGQELVWRIDNLESIGGHAVTRLGNPRVVQSDRGPVVEFDGKADGLVLNANPLEGLRTFRLEAEVWPAADGPEEQRFVHVEEDGWTGNRALLETRMLPGGGWALDTFLNFGSTSLTLIDRSHAHPTQQWHTVVLVVNGREMLHIVNGKTEAKGLIAFTPLGPGRTSLGVRLNQVSWFKGRLRQVTVRPG